MRIRSVEFDFDTEVIEIGLEDGTSRRQRFSPWPTEATTIRHWRVDFAAGELLLRLPNQRDATVELAVPGFAASQLLGDRIVVYLDQNLWSRLAAARYGHRPVRPREAAAAHTLAEHVASRRIILPVSAAHFLETGRHRGSNRDPLASTLLELSRGWQMRHPGVIGGTELVGAVTHQLPTDRAEIFTLKPNATFLRPFPPPAPRYPEPLGSTISNVIAASATYDAVIDPSGFPDEGVDARRQWAAAQDALVELFAEKAASRDLVHRAALGRLLLDYASDELQNGKRIGLAAFKSWLPNAAHEVTQMPYLGRLWRVMFTRLRNGSKWSDNDLIDIHNLSAAAGYADVIAGEKRTISDLRLAKPVTAGARLGTTLEEAVGAIEQATI